jgi:hypothetical protein
MSSHDWILSPGYPLCGVSDTYYRSVQPIFRGLTGAITPELLAAVTNALELVRADFGLSVGRHRCVRDLHQEAIARLRCLAAIAQPEEPPPAPPPPPKPSSPSLEDVVKQFEEEEELFLGEIRDEGKGDNQK